MTHLVAGVFRTIQYKHWLVSANDDAHRKAVTPKAFLAIRQK